METKQLIEERVGLFEKNKALLNRASGEKRNLSAEEQLEFDRQDARGEEIRKQLDNIAKVDAEERALGESRGRQTTTVIKSGEEATAKDRDLAVRAWALAGHPNKMTRAMIAAAEKISVSFSNREFETYFNPEQRALSVGTTDAGGYSVADEPMKSFIDVQKWFGRVRNNATVLTTSTGASLPIPTANDTTNVGEIIAEAGPVTTTADPVFGQTVLGAWKYSSKAVIVSVELLQDSSINIPQYLGQKLGERIARIQNTHYTTGAGTTLPFGIVTSASLGKTAAATNAITWDEMIDLRHSVDIAYRGRPGSGFMISDTVAAYLRKLKASTSGDYYWEPSIVAGMPDRALGENVYINNDMSSTFATNNRLAIYGDLASYYIRDAGGVQFYRADELRILNHQVVFLAFQRSDGALPDVTAVRYLRTA